MNQILIIDDEEKLRSLLSRIIEMEGFEVFQAKDCASGLKILDKNDVDVVISDVKLPDGSGVDLVRSIKEKNAIPEIILLTAYGNIPDSVTAIKNGAFDYLTKGDDNNKIIPLIYKALEKVALAKKVAKLEQKLHKNFSFDTIVGNSKSITEIKNLAKKVAKTDITVLLTGETGTGKELFAQAIHHESLRSRQNFVAINCSAFSKDLLENELFGHKAGSFTGANKDQKGLFEEAHKGTLFLDEIGEMVLELQAKILRVLETGEFLKIGDTKPTKIDVRIIAATNRNLQQEIQNGNFRKDLFYRISAFQIHIPPLRERQEDIPELIEIFATQFAYNQGKKVEIISENFIKVLQNQPWNGNIRELRNMVERSLILMEGNELMEDTLPMETLTKSNFSENSNSIFNLSEIEKRHILKILKHTQNNKTKTAELLGIGTATLYRKLSEYGIS
jgi:DNA-binding NtrC family response regulator